MSFSTDKTQFIESLKQYQEAAMSLTTTARQVSRLLKTTDTDRETLAKELDKAIERMEEA